MIWIQFIISAVIVIAGGRQLVGYAELISDKHRLTRLWLGFILLAGVTSIPELGTAIGAVTIVKAPRLALGDVLGSNAFNIFIVPLIALAAGGLNILNGQNWKSCRNLIFFGCVMTLTAAGGIALARAGHTFTLGPVGLFAAVLLVLYLAASISLYRGEHAGQEEPLPPGRDFPPAIYLKLGGAVLAVVGAGFWLSYSGNRIAEITGWGTTFVGALLLALVTSLPEVAVSLTAAKRGHSEMALGNILGSNIFNLAILFWTDLAYGRRSLLAQGGNADLAAAALGLLLTLATGAGIFLGRSRPPKSSPWIPLLIAALYLGGMYCIFAYSSR
ncbi:MAG TPA: hypothetical protein PLI51_04575 [bacterium]|nr:hypothetical protein [bacterium]HPQ65985.1 hypothetical protein [bacterium]